MPRLSILLPVHDAGSHLAASLASLWRQTFTDFEVVAIDDGSADGSGEMLDRAAETEPRLRVVHRPHRGLPATLNAGLAVASGEWIGRHDADDLSHRRRFALQTESLEVDPGLAVVGCRLRVFPAGSGWVGMRRWAAWHNSLLDHDAMAREVLVDSPLAHATALLRRSWLERVGGWREYDGPEDLDLWIRLLAQGARLAKRPEVLYAWRQHAASATRQERYAQHRLDARKREALDAGLLANARVVTVVGVGRALERWRAEFAAAGRTAHAVVAGRPPDTVQSALQPPAVFVFRAPPARTRWRVALAAAGWTEGVDFIFVV